MDKKRKLEIIGKLIRLFYQTLLVWYSLRKVNTETRTLEKPQLIGITNPKVCLFVPSRWKQKLSSPIPIGDETKNLGQNEG